MERAVLLARLSEGGVPEGCDRLYLGSEFCERLLPSREELARAVLSAKKARVPLTLVTPFATDEGLARVEGLLGVMPGGSEVVFNDWGVLSRLGRFEPVMGRLLTYQRRDPNVARLLERLTPEARDYLRDVSLSQEGFRELLHERGVGRAEFDNPSQGIGFSLAKGPHPLRGSLYHPWVYVTTTRLCLSRSCTRPEARDELGILPCGRECRRVAFTLAHASMPAPLVLRGNTVFYRNDRMPPDLAERGFDRIVVEPAPPPCAGPEEGRRFAQADVVE